MFLFLRHIDEHHRLTKMFEAIKDSLVEWNRPVQNVLQVSWVAYDKLYASVASNLSHSNVLFLLVCRSKEDIGDADKI